jgi:hypothetical protein
MGMSSLCYFTAPLRMRVHRRSIDHPLIDLIAQPCRTSNDPTASNAAIHPVSRNEREITSLRPPPYNRRLVPRFRKKKRHPDRAPNAHSMCNIQSPGAFSSESPFQIYRPDRPFGPTEWPANSDDKSAAGRVSSGLLSAQFHAPRLLTLRPSGAAPSRRASTTSQCTACRISWSVTKS